MNSPAEKALRRVIAALEHGDHAGGNELSSFCWDLLDEINDDFPSIRWEAERGNLTSFQIKDTEK